MKDLRAIYFLTIILFMLCSSCSQRTQAYYLTKGNSNHNAISVGYYRNAIVLKKDGTNHTFTFSGTSLNDKIKLNKVNSEGLYVIDNNDIYLSAYNPRNYVKTYSIKKSEDNYYLGTPEAIKDTLTPFDIIVNVDGLNSITRGKISKKRTRQLLRKLRRMKE